MRKTIILVMFLVLFLVGCNTEIDANNDDTLNLLFCYEPNLTFNLSSLDKGKVEEFNFKEYIEQIIDNNDIILGIEEVWEERFNVTVTPSGEQLLFTLPGDHVEYKDYDLLKQVYIQAEKKGYDFDEFVSSLYKQYKYIKVCYSIKDKKMSVLNEVSELDKNFITNKFLSLNYYYCSKSDKIINIKLEGYEQIFHNYLEDKIIFASDTHENDKNIKFIIYDLEKETIIDEIKIEDKKIIMDYNVSQWTNKDKILFTVNEKAYQYNIKNKELKELGHNKFYPKMINDRYLVYAKIPHPLERFDDWDISTFKDPMGIYAEDLKTGNIITIHEGDWYDILSLEEYNKYN